jgi:tetraacyldisaccharide 4'-kinase
MARTQDRSRSRLERLWSQHWTGGDRILSIPLMAAGGLYRGALGVRNLWWRGRALKPGVPTLSVGNLTVGGNAKTPFTVFVAARLRARGLKVAIVSRGYRARKTAARATLVATGGSLLVDPEVAGDEPAMMARRFDGPIVIARRRIDAIRLLAREHPVNAVVLDDAFQHTRLRRNLDLVLVSHERGFGNARMLPAGPMREPLSALGRADAVVIVCSGDNPPSALTPSQMKRIERRPVLHAMLRPRCLVNVERGQWCETSATIGGRRVLAVSGLANPAGFYAMLRELDADLVGVLEYPDHHAYTSADWHALGEAARNVDMVITTEKDLVKLERFPFARDSLYALRIEVSMAPQDARALDELIALRMGFGVPDAPRGADQKEVGRNAS